MEFRPLHSTGLITQIAIVSMLHLFVYEIPEEEEGDPKLRLSNLSRLIPSDFYGNRVSVKPEYLFKPWKQQYQKYKMKTIRVVAAVIKAVKEDGRTMIFATQRGYGEFKGGWEFPGGKIEAGETPQEALKREIMEELDTEVAVGEWIETVEYDYPGFHLSMDCFWCEIVKGDLVLKEHEAARWLTREELTDVEWLPADVAVAEKIEEEMD